MWVEAPERSWKGVTSGEMSMAAVPAWPLLVARARVQPVGAVLDAHRAARPLPAAADSRAALDARGLAVFEVTEATAGGKQQILASRHAIPAGLHVSGEHPYHIRRATAPAAVIHDFNHAQVITLDLLAKGYRYHEVPISYHPRYGEEKKLTPLDGIPTLWALIKYRLMPLKK